MPSVQGRERQRQASLWLRDVNRLPEGEHQQDPPAQHQGGVWGEKLQQCDYHTGDSGSVTITLETQAVWLSHWRLRQCDYHTGISGSVTDIITPEALLLNTKLYFM